MPEYSAVQILLAKAAMLSQSAPVSVDIVNGIGPALAFAGHHFVVAGATALYWPARSALIVADLHLEKASWFALRGQMLPPYDSRATLEQLAALVALTQARALWCLGDNFHDDDGVDRLEDEARRQLFGLMASVDWHWIIGNHDAGLGVRIGGAVHSEACLDGVTLRHQASMNDSVAELSGHYHPKVRVGRGSRSVSRPCFVRSATRLILPAFGAFTGGMNAADPVILAACGGRAEALVSAGDRLLAFPLSAPTASGRSVAPVLHPPTRT